MNNRGKRPNSRITTLHCAIVLAPDSQRRFAYPTPLRLLMALPEIRRSDFSNGLVHLTRERKEYSSPDFLTQKLDRIVPPFDVLKEILTSGIIRGSRNEGYVKGNRPAVCLSEIPLCDASIRNTAI